MTFEVINSLYQMNVMAILPLDVITDILLRLPAKSVLRFKSVCKLWYSLINGPGFIRLHLDRSLATRSNRHFVFRAPTLHLADFDTFDNAIELDYPFKETEYGGAHVLGSCHGLLCLYAFDCLDSLFLYNPTTRTHKILPFFPVSSQFHSPKGHPDTGFGYDYFSGDYKCVRMYQKFYEESGSFESEVFVYCLKADSWRRVQDLPYYFYYHSGRSALVDGAVHWVGEDGNGVFVPIVRFDLKDETFSSIPLPPNLHKHIYMRLSVGVIDECLCLMVNHLYHCDVWIMKEYGVPGSWMKLFSVKKRESYEDLVRPISFSISGNELFLCHCLYDIVKLDMETMEVMDVKVSDFRKSVAVWVCVENLLMLNDTCDDLVDEQEHGRKRSRKNRR